MPMEEFLKSFSPSTAKSYRSALRMFNSFYRTRYGGDIEDFLDEVERDLQTPRRSRRFYARKVLREYKEYLEGIGLAPKSIWKYLSAVQSYARFYEIPISLRYIHMPSTRPISRKYPWTLEEAIEFIEIIEHPTVKAMAAITLQSGIGLSELLSLKYGDIMEEYERGVIPLCLDLYRVKTDNPFMTFAERYSVGLLREYLEEHRPDISPEDPLFKISGRRVQQILRKCGKIYLDEKEYEGVNPCRLHSLRTAFRTLMADAGCPDHYLEFFMGHKTQDLRRVYTSKSREGWRQTYKQYSHAIQP